MSTKTPSENNCKWCWCKPWIYDTTCECNCHKLPIKTPREQLIKHLLPVYNSHLQSSIAEITVQGIVDFSMPVIDALLEEARQEEREKAQSLEKLIEEIGKDMCHFKFLYPNAWKWTIQDMWDWEHQGETLMEVFQAFKKEREKQKKI